MPDDHLPDGSRSQYRAPPVPDDATTSARIPAGTRLTLTPDTRRLAAGLIVGGAPWRLLRLTPAGDRWLDRWSVGQPVPDEAPARRLATRLVDAGLAWSRRQPDLRHPMTGPSSVIVIPCRDRAAGLAATLAAIDPGVDVIVVDDASTDPEQTATAVAGRPRTRLVRRLRHGGPAAARNVGWRRAAGSEDGATGGFTVAGAGQTTGDETDAGAADDRASSGASGPPELIAFLDTECIPPPGWLRDLAGHFADPTVGAVAPRIRTGATPGTTGWLQAYEQVRSPLDLGPLPAPVRPGSTVSYVPSAALVVRRAALVEIGGFDDRLFTGEDVDLVWRLGRAAWRVRYDPSVVVAHPARPTLAAWLRQRVGYGRSAAPLASRHGRAVTPLVISRWSAAAWVLAGLGHPVLAAALVAAATGRTVQRVTPVATPDAGPEIVRLVATSHLRAGLALSDAIRRAWWPLAVGGALAWRRLRVPLAGVVIVPPLLEWRQRRPALGLLPWIALRLADDLAYGWGVWAGAGRDRRIACLRPHLS